MINAIGIVFVCLLFHLIEACTAYLPQNKDNKLSGEILFGNESSSHHEFQLRRVRVWLIFVYNYKDSLCVYIYTTRRL